MKSFFKTLQRQIFSLQFLGVFLAVVFVFNVVPSLSFVVFDQFSPVETALANSDAEPQSLRDTLNDPDAKNIRAKVSEIASLFVGLFVPLIAILVKFIGVLMGDDYIFGNAGSDGNNIAQLLYELWDIVRTIVNYGFLLMLLFYAVMNIVPWGTDDYNIKNVLPSLVLAIVVVNLTWFGVRVVFDVVDVTSRIVYGLPEALTAGEKNAELSRKCVLSTKANQKDVFEDGSKEPKAEATQKSEGDHIYVHGNCYPAYVGVHFEKALSGNSVYTEKDANIDDKIERLKDQKKDASESVQKSIDKQIENLNAIKEQVKNGGGVVDYGTMVIYWTDFDYDKFDESGIAQLFAFSIMQIQNLPRTAYSNISNLALKKDGVVQDIKEGSTGGWTALFINTVASLIIMVLVGLLFVMMLINLFFRVIILWVNIIASPLMAFQIAWKGPGNGANPASDFLGAAVFLKHAFAPVIMGIPLVIGFIMITIGKSHDFVMDGQSGNVTDFTGPLIDGIHDVHQLFFYIMTIAILWIGGVKAVEATTAEFVQSTFISPIKGGVESIAGAIAKAPLYMQFIPVGDVDKDSPGVEKASLSNIFSDIPQGFKNTINVNNDSFTNMLRGVDSNPNNSATDRFFNNNSTIRHNRDPIVRELENLNDINPSTFNNYQNVSSEEDLVNQYLDSHQGLRALLNNADIGLQSLIQLEWESRNKGRNATTDRDAIDHVSAVMSSARNVIDRSQANQQPQGNASPAPVPTTGTTNAGTAPAPVAPNAAPTPATPGQPGGAGPNTN